MRNTIITLFASLLLQAAAFAETPQASFDWKPWRSLAVQDGGRYKPLDTLAWETLRTLCNRASFVDPDSGEKLDATALYLTMLLEWQGWDQGSAANPHGMMKNPHAGTPDKWDNALLLRVDYLELRNALGMAEDQKYISPAELARAKIRDPQSGRETSFLLWTQKVSRDEARGLPTLERKALDLAGSYFTYRDHRAGKRMGVIPLAGGEHEQWMTVADLMKSNPKEADDSTGAIRKAKEQFQKVRAAFLSKSAEAFNAASADFIATLQETGPELGTYPTRQTIDLEVAYNHWAPFRFAWIFSMLAFFLVALSMGTNWKPLYAVGVVLFVLGFAAMIAGFGLRTAISGRAPVTNMYESVVYLALGTAVFGLIFELIYRSRYIMAAAAGVTTVALILADNCPAILDPSLKPLQPVLRSNFWLVTHVMSITLSYAAFALALGVSNITLGYYLVRSKNEEAIAALTRFTYKALQVGVLLLAIGTILGGVWADYSWGRFWGWDPKEVWALIALLGYLAVLHARYVGWVNELGLAALSVSCFALVVMAWYGVNFVLGAGLHSYGFGGGGQGYVYSAVALQMLYVAAAVAVALLRNTVSFSPEPTARAAEAVRGGLQAK
jgi:cytochrome c-type biogenesis protein CcsB